MLFKGSLTKIAKARPLVSCLRSYRYTHTGCARQFILSKSDELHKVNRPYSLPTFSRRFSIANSKKKGQQENEKAAPKSRTVGLDLMAPNFKVDRCTLQPTVKNRKELGGKSLTLKMCKQPSNNLCTASKGGPFFSAKDASAYQGHPKTETVPSEDVDIVVSMKKADFCDAICGPKPQTVKITATTVSLEEQRPERFIDRLTDAEIEEICKKRCPCRHSDESNSTLHTEKTERLARSASTETQTSTTKNVNSVKIQSLTSATTESANSRNRRNRENQHGKHKILVESMVPSKLEKTRHHQRHRPSRQYRVFLRHDHRQLYRSDPTTLPHNKFSLEKNFVQRTMNQAKKSAKFENTSTSMAPVKPKNSTKWVTSTIKRKRESRAGKRNILSRPYRNILHHATYALSAPPMDHQQIRMVPAMPIPVDIVTQRTVAHPLPIPPRTSNRISSEYAKIFRYKQPSGAVTTYQQRLNQRIQRNVGKAFPHRNYAYSESVCPTEPLKPMPLRFRPIYPQNYHSDPVVQERPPNFDPRYMGVLYERKAFGRLQLVENRKREWKSRVVGSESSRNRNTFEMTKKSIDRTIIPPIEVDNTNTVPVAISTAIALPVTDEVLITNVDVEDKIQRVNLPDGSIDTVQQSRRIMSKLVENLSVVVQGPGKLNLVSSSYPQLRNEKDVLIQMEYVSLTDADTRHYLTGKYNSYSYATTEIGRTGSGIVVETGKDVHNVKPGDKVFVQAVSCGKCKLCLSDRRNLCEYVTATEMSPVQGILSRLHVHSSDFVIKIPDDINILSGAMTGTLSTAIRACQKVAISPGDFVMVIHGGHLGIATGLVAQLMGAATVCLADTRKPVLEEALKLGIDKVFLLDPKSPSRNTAIKIWEKMGQYPRVTFDCRGSAMSNDIAINATQTGGKVVVMTCNGIPVTVPLSNIVTRDIDIIISTSGNIESDTAALKILKTKKIFPDSIMDTHYDLSNVHQAFECLYGPNRIDSQIIVKCGCQCGTSNNSKKQKCEKKP